MNFERLRNYLIFTGMAMIVCLVSYICISAFLLRPHLIADSIRSRSIHGALGLMLLMVFTPIKRGLEVLVDRIVQKRKTDYDLLRNRLISICNMHVDLETTIKEVRRTVIESLQVEEVFIASRYEGKFVLSMGDEEERVPKDNLVLQKLLSDPEQPLNINSNYVRRDIELYKFMKGMNIVYVLPLYIGDNELIGWICLRDSRKRYRLYTNDIVELPNLQSFFAISLHHARIDKKLRDRIDELIALNRISQTMNSSLNVKETLETIMDAVIELAHVDRALMYLRQDDNGQFKPTISRGETEDINLDFVIDPRKSIFDTLLNTREPLVVEDSKNDERVNQKYAAFVKTKSFVLIPIVSKEEVIGIIGVDNLFSKRSVNEINVDLLVTLANHAAIAISNSRLFESTQLFNEKLQEEVRLATEHLEKLLDMKSHFLQVASHQLRTPTTILRGLLSMILEDPEMKDEEKHKNMGQAYTVVNRLDRIIAELLSATELEDTIDRPIIEKVNLLELIQQIVNELKPLAYDRKNKLIVHIPESVDEVYSNPFKLKEAISNLVDNALRYTQKGTVTISVEDNGAEISVHVIDTGVGLTEEDKKIIFDKFSRGLKISQVEPNGTGLGLFIVQRIAEMLDGKIECLSEGEGKGSEFILIFPNTRG